jgi:hypothetical protein
MKTFFNKTEKIFTNTKNGLVRKNFNTIYYGKVALFIIALTFNSFSIHAQNTINLSTPTNWTNFGSPGITTNATTFYGHSNWMQLQSPSGNSMYQFKRIFYVARAGVYTISGMGMGNNHMTLYINASSGTSVFNKNITDAAQFNSPEKFSFEAELKCGKNEIIVHLRDDGDGNAGFYVDMTVKAANGKLSNEPMNCEVVKEVCGCPKGWLSNTSNKDGDITGDGQCKKMVCGPLDIKPAIKNIGFEGGFFWDNYVYVAGTKANGGAPICKKEWVVEGVNPNTKAGEGRGEK